MELILQSLLRLLDSLRNRPEYGVVTERRQQTRQSQMKLMIMMMMMRSLRTRRHDLTGSVSRRLYSD
jgi:hypothetical protein